MIPPRAAHRARSLLTSPSYKDDFSMVDVSTKILTEIFIKMKLATFFNVALVSGYGGEGSNNQLKSLAMGDIRYIYDNPLCQSVRGENYQLQALCSLYLALKICSNEVGI